MKQLLVIIAIVPMIFSETVLDVNNSSSIIYETDRSSSVDDNIFSTPDLSFDSLSDEGTIHLDAYKTTKNDEIIASNEPDAYGGLRWVSIGRPKLVPKGVNTDGSPKLVKFTDEYFSLYFDMLTEEQRKMLKEEVKRVKGIDVSTRSFVNLKPNTIECLSRLYDRKTQKRFILKGKVVDFISSPFQIKFPYEFNAPETMAAKEKIAQNSNIEIECKVTAGSQIKKTNSFSLSVQEINDLKLEEKLFGDANETYVSRDQLSELANQIYINFNIVEDYQIAGEEFSRDFIDNLIVLTGENFKFVDFNDALESLSKFSLDISSDLDANVISKEISNIFKIEAQGNKSHIVFDEAYFKQLEKQSTSSSGGSGSFNLLNVIGVGATGSHISGKQENSIDAGTSLNDQLSELNSYEENSIEFQFEGNKIVPKSLKVAKLQSAGFKKILKFNRIKSVYYEADFKKDFIIATEESTSIPDFVVDIVGQLDDLRRQIVNANINIRNNTNSIEINKSQRLAFEAKSVSTSNSLSTQLKRQKVIVQKGRWQWSSVNGSLFGGNHDITIHYPRAYKNPPTVFLSVVHMNARHDEPVWNIGVSRIYGNHFVFFLHLYWRPMWHIHIEWIAIGFED